MRSILVLLTCAYIAAAGIAARTQRFDDVVRDDFFAGMSGDSARFDRAMATCEDLIARDPRNAPAIVWHGAGLLVRSGIAFRAGRFDDGRSLRTSAMREMNDAIAMRPHDIQVLIPRAAILVASARFAPADQVREMAAVAAADYEQVLAIEAPVMSTRGTHPRGELLGGLATAYRLAGDFDRATMYLRRITADLPDSAYDRKAQTWLADLSAVRQDDHFCLGCHAR